MESRITELEHEVEGLQNTVAILSSDLQRLKKRLRQLEQERAEEEEVGSRASGSLGGSYSVVDSAGVAPPSRGTSVASPSPGAVSRASEAVVSSWARREEICDGIAAWVQRSLRGDHRGTSGRDQIPLGNRVWLVFRDIAGTEFRPVRVYHTFAEAKALVKRGSDSGDSIYVGLPSEREARRVAVVSGVGYPESR